MLHGLILASALLAQTAPAAPSEEIPASGPLEALRAEYQADAKKYEFHAGAAGEQALKFSPKPIMRWANDDDWSGDVFVWTSGSVPAVIGCMLSGPSGADNRIAFHEFHLLADKPIAPADLHTSRRWQPASGLERRPLPDAPVPADTPAGRLVQMRNLTRDFTAQMEADGNWELRLLPQPLMRYGDEQTDAIDGALFAWVWTKGTDPELILVLECRKTAAGAAWHFSPVRFSNRALALDYHDQEVWSADSHKEPAEKTTTLIYTTAYARTFPRP